MGWGHPKSPKNIVQEPQNPRKNGFGVRLGLWQLGIPKSLFPKFPKQWNRRNERGETPLHRACIEGDPKRVRLYLEQGHPVNPRDYCGWTPLHEAANHGHLEVARLLLAHGAALDDPGGPGCDGITPLHDALGSGRFPVAKLLIQSGANVTARNSKGQTPLGTLQEWLRSYGNELDGETWEFARETQGMLQEALAARKAPPEPNQDPLLDPEPPEPQTPEPQTPNPRTGGSLSPFRKRQRIPEAGNGEENGELGNPSLENPKFPPGNPKPALIPLEEFLEQEDWLEDDLGLYQKSRKRPRAKFQGFQEFRRSRDPKILPGTRKGHSREPQIQENPGNDPLDSQESPGVTPDVPQIPEPSGIIPNPPQIPKSSRIIPNPPQIPESSRIIPNPPQIPESSRIIPNPPQIPESSRIIPNPPQIPTLRIRIRIQDDVFLIPVVPRPEHSVGWLTELTAERFSQSSGMSPKLLLRKDGALLAPQDAVGDVLCDGDEVQAEIQGWDLPPLPERYRRVCASLGLAPLPALLRLLELQAQSSRLGIPGGISLPQPHIPALLRALKLQELRELRLHGAPGIGNSSGTTTGKTGTTTTGTTPGTAELSALLVTLPRLERLELPGVGLGAQGLRELGHCFGALQELDLSLNPLGDSGGQALAELLPQCPALVTLHVRGCGLSRPFPIPEVTSLRTLSLSCNPLGSALGQLLRTIPAQSVRSLELRSVRGHGDSGNGIGRDLGRDLGEFLQQDRCALSHLSLAGNCLGDSDVEELARSLPRCPSLVSLDLSANPGISSTSLRILLEALEQRGEGLEFLSLAGCSVGPLDESTWSCSTGKIRDLRLCRRRLWKSP